jgi:hypothetical protein
MSEPVLEPDHKRDMSSNAQQLGMSHHRVEPDKMYILMAFVVVLLLFIFGFVGMDALGSNE